MATSVIKNKLPIVVGVSKTFAFNNEANKEITFDVSKSGYKPIGIGGWNITTSANYYFLRLFINGNNAIAYMTHKNATTATTTISADIYIFYIPI